MRQSFKTVTELPGSGAPTEQVAMLYTRYHLAASVSQGKDVLEVACGPGIGLGYLAKRARMIVGGDYDEELLRYARGYYRDGIRLLRLDAHNLPFADGSFDVVILFEALYYFAAPEKFVDEARRVLRPQGTLLVCTANKDWFGFNPSPFAERYFSVSELHGLLASRGFATELYGSFPINAATLRDRLLLAVRRFAVTLHLIPTTMKGKELFKKLVYGKLSSLPSELQEGIAEPSALVPLVTYVPTSAFKVLYAIGRAP